MSNDNSDAPCWSPSSFGHLANTSPVELAMLGAHLDRCQKAHGRWLRLQCMWDAVKAFMSSRLVTMLMVSLLLMVLITLLR